ncbi:MAG: high-potential iron-sulfur protein [Xanthobacteraceae bacterium]
MESKRNFVRLTLLGLLGLSGFLGAIGMCAAPARTRAAGEKLSKQQAEYQDSPKGIQMCATCTLFEAPHSCKVVEGDVNPNGWCKAYAMAD